MTAWRGLTLVEVSVLQLLLLSLMLAMRLERSVQTATLGASLRPVDAQMLRACRSSAAVHSLQSK